MEAWETRDRRFPAGLLIAAVLILVFALARFLPEPGEKKTEIPAAEPTVLRTEPATAELLYTYELTYPTLLAENRLELQSLFQFSGVNPDSGNQSCDNVAAIRLRNVSGSYLAEAELALTLQDGTVLNFRVAELPAGGTVMAFCTDNLPLKSGAKCAEAACRAEFVQPDLSGKITASAEGITVTVRNTSEEDLINLVVYCRCVLGEEYFGGVTYAYTIENLPAGGSTEVEAWECIPGSAEVVRIAINES